MANDTVKCSSIFPVPYPRRSRYWLEDGSLVLSLCHNVYKVHKTLLFRHSPTLTKWTRQQKNDHKVTAENLFQEVAGCAHVRVPDEVGLRDEDLEALLEHLYHDV